MKPTTAVVDSVEMLELFFFVFLLVGCLLDVYPDDVMVKEITVLSPMEAGWRREAEKRAGSAYAFCPGKVMAAYGVSPCEAVTRGKREHMTCIH